MAHGGPWKTKPVGAGLLYSPTWVYHIRCGNNYLMNLDQLAIRSLLEWSSISTIYVVTWRREVVSLAHSTSDNQPDHLKASINIAIFACAGFPSLTKRGGSTKLCPCQLPNFVASKVGKPKLRQRPSTMKSWPAGRSGHTHDCRMVQPVISWLNKNLAMR